MASTLFIDGSTLIQASWLNDVNVATYTTLPALSANVAANYAPLNSPNLITPNLGVATATSINGVTINPGVLSGTNTGNQLIFQTIAVSGQSNVVADTTADTLTLAAGAGITITTNAATDTVTITNTNPAPPSLVLLTTVTPTAGSNTLDLLNVFSSTYDKYLIQINGVIETGTASALQLRLANAGVVDTAANYWQVSATNMAQVTSAAPFLGGTGATSTISINNVNSGTSIVAIKTDSSFNSLAATYVNDSIGVAYTKLSTVSGFRLFWANGASLFAAQGTVRVYGYSNV